MEDNKEKEKKFRHSFSLKKFIGLCFKNWYWFALSLFICGLIAALMIMKRVQEYEIDAQVMLPQETSSSSLMAEMARSFSFGDIIGSSTSTDNELDVMRSHTVFLNTVKELGMNVSYSEKQGLLRWVPIRTKAPLEMKLSKELADTLSTTLKFEIKRNEENNTMSVKLKVKKKTIYEIEDKALPLVMHTPYGDFTLTKTAYFAKDLSKRYRVTVAPWDDAAEDCKDAVKIFIPNKKSDFIGLSLITNEVEFGKKLLSTILANYNALGIAQQDERNTKSLEFVNTRLQSLTGELATSEKEIEEFKESNKLTDPEIDARLLLEKSSTIEAGLIEAQTENEILGLTKQFVADPSNEFSLIPMLGGDITNPSASYTSATNEITSYNQLILERMKLQNSAKGNNSQLKAVDEQIEALRNNIITSVDRAYKNSQVKLSEIESENSKTSSRIGEIPSLERRYLGLKRVQLVQEQLYLFLLKQREEISMTIARTSPTVVTIDNPYVSPEKIGLSPKMILLIAIFIGFLVPLILLFLRKYNETTVSRTADFEEAIKAPILGAVGGLRRYDGLVMRNGSESESMATEMIRALRNKVQHYLSGADSNRVVLVTSSKEGEGATFLAANLAEAFAMQGKRTLLIDADLRHPHIAGLYDLDDKEGLLQYLDGTSSTPNIHTITVAGARSLDVLTAGGSSPISAELLGDNRFGELMERLESEYDCIIIDSTPILRCSDSFELARYAYLTLMAVRAGVTDGRDLQFINTIYQEGRLPRIAVVINGVKGAHSLTASTTQAPA